MITELDEKQFIHLYSEKKYLELCQNTYNQMREMPEYKNMTEYMRSMMVFDYKLQDVPGTIIVEAEIYARQIMKQRVDDFKICKLAMSDEEMPDEVLDRYNEYMKAKEIMKNKNHV